MENEKKDEVQTVSEVQTVVDKIVINKKEKKVEITKEELNRHLANEVRLNKFKASHEKSQNKRKARIAIILAKAEKKGITCTDAEINEWIASH